MTTIVICNQQQELLNIQIQQIQYDIVRDTIYEATTIQAEDLMFQAEAKKQQSQEFNNVIGDRFSTYQKTANTFGLVGSSMAMAYATQQTVASGIAAAAAGTSVATAVAWPIVGFIGATFLLAQAIYAICAE